MSRRYLFGGREGFSSDTLLAWGDITVANPLVSAALLAYLLKKAGAPLNSTILGWLLNRKNRTWPVAVSGLVLLGSLFKYTSDLLSHRARNNGVTDTYDWSKEIVLVTGASSGIGARVCQMLSEKGVRIAGIDMQSPLYPVPSTMKFYTCDITDREALKAVGDKIRADMGDPTVLFNNAGIGRGGAIMSIKEKDVQAVMNVNALSHYWTCQEFLPAMIAKNHGHVVTTASMASYMVPAGLSAYGMSKAAALCFHETLTMELRMLHKTPKIRTSIINPMWVATPLLGTSNAEKGKKAAGPIPLHVDTVAEAIADTILSGESKHVVIPRSLTFLGSCARGFPDWFHYGMLWEASDNLANLDSNDPALKNARAAGTKS